MDLYAVTMMPATDDVRTVVSAMRCSTSAMRAWKRIREEGNDGALTGQQCKDGYRPGRGNRLGERARRRIYELCRENARYGRRPGFYPLRSKFRPQNTAYYGAAARHLLVLAARNRCRRQVPVCLCMRIRGLLLASKTWGRRIIQAKL